MPSSIWVRIAHGNHAESYRRARDEGQDAARHESARLIVRRQSRQSLSCGASLLLHTRHIPPEGLKLQSGTRAFLTQQCEHDAPAPDVMISFVSLAILRQIIWQMVICIIRHSISARCTIRHSILAHCTCKHELLYNTALTILPHSSLSLSSGYSLTTRVRLTSSLCTPK